MSQIALADNDLLENQIQDFLHQELGSPTAVSPIAHTHEQGRTYLEWYSYFKDKKFQPDDGEAPLMERVLRELFEAMVRQAEVVAENWNAVLPSTRQRYQRLALALARRKPSQEHVKKIIRYTTRIGRFSKSRIKEQIFFPGIGVRNDLLEKFKDTIILAIEKQLEKTESSEDGVERIKRIRASGNAREPGKITYRELVEQWKQEYSEEEMRESSEFYRNRFERDNPT
ncbi:hypothetical protein [Leptolyngbya sp. FACHB-8]|nr:hypothetical protein [Leptolyngbya sp. FACHB-8]MBD1912874.1 hypothetical protein [Leptolyngbya sp. FACHB-8]